MSLVIAIPLTLSQHWNGRQGVPDERQVPRHVFREAGVAGQINDVGCDALG